MDHNSISNNATPSEPVLGLYHVNPRWYADHGEYSKLSTPAESLQNTDTSKLHQAALSQPINIVEHQDSPEQPAVSEEQSTSKAVEPSGNVNASVHAGTSTSEGHQEQIQETEQANAQGGSKAPSEPNNSEHVYTSNQSNAAGEVSVGRTLDVDSSDADSALGDDTSSITTSISSSVTDYRYEHGRRYHAYYDGAYYLPNDELESDRLDLQHHVWRMTLNNALYISPIPDNIERVLDVGTGTGIWAIEYAQEHPNTQVIGVDLSPIQPTMVPPNCSFIVDNAEQDWVYDVKFDFIHSRMLVLGIHDWDRFFRQAWDNMKPGGWIELHELQLPCCCDDGSATRESPFVDWSYKLMEAAAIAGIDGRSCDGFETQLQRQGFINLKHDTIKWAIGSWPKGRKEKDIGRWMLENTLQALQGLTMALYTRFLKWSMEAVELFLVGVRKQMFDRSSHVYVEVRVFSAQKPHDS